AWKKMCGIKKISRAFCCIVGSCLSMKKTECFLHNRHGQDVRANGISCPMDNRGKKNYIINIRYEINGTHYLSYGISVSKCYRK
ncbi:MAG TPA: hypothetical protein VNW06_11425, partial [Cytophagaceae bacterium]|nr:hypothetical protein [Cytophagaceae bacterium]